MSTSNSSKSPCCAPKAASAVPAKVVGQPTPCTCCPCESPTCTCDPCTCAKD